MLREEVAQIKEIAREIAREEIAKALEQFRSESAEKLAAIEAETAAKEPKKTHKHH